MKLPVFSAFAAAALATLGACSAFTPPIAKPIIEDHAQKQINTFAVMPSRRMVIVKSNVNQQGDAMPATGLTDTGLLPDRAVMLCAEASPDVSDDIAASVAAAAAAKGPVPAGGASAPELGASFAQVLATTGQALFKRTQALQLYRDIGYHLCQAKMNGFIDDKQFGEKLAHAEATASSVMQYEIPWLYLSQTLGDAQRESIKAALKQNITVGPDSITVEHGANKTVVPIPGRAASAPGR
jgi:hypothetical protein